MRITLSGQTIAFTGKIAGYTQPELLRHLSHYNAQVEEKLHEGVTLLLAGRSRSKRLVDQAQALGITILEGDALAALLRDGEVTWEPAQGAATVRDVIGELRGLLDGKPDHAKWHKLTALLDQCAPDQLDDVVAYLAPQLQGWQRGPEVAMSSSYMRSHGLLCEAAGALRLTPPGWLLAMLRGEANPKHKLANALSFSQVKLTATIANTLFERADLSHLTCFDTLSQNLIMGAAFYKAMAKATTLNNVEALVLRQTEDRLVLPALESGALPSLKRLFLPRISPQTVSPTHNGALLVEGPWMANLELIGFGCLPQLQRFAANPSQSPALRHITLHIHNLAARYTGIDDLPQWLDALRALTPQLASIALRIEEPARLATVLRALDPMHAPQLRVLDLSPSHALSLSADDAHTQLATPLLATGLAAQLDQLILNAQLNAQAGDVLRAAGIPATSAY